MLDSEAAAPLNNDLSNVRTLNGLTESVKELLAEAIWGHFFRPSRWGWSRATPCHLSSSHTDVSTPRVALWHCLPTPKAFLVVTQRIHITLWWDWRKHQGHLVKIWHKTCSVRFRKWLFPFDHPVPLVWERGRQPHLAGLKFILKGHFCAVPGLYQGNLSDGSSVWRRRHHITSFCLWCSILSLTLQ